MAEHASAPRVVSPIPPTQAPDHPSRQLRLAAEAFGNGDAEVLGQTVGAAAPAGGAPRVQEPPAEAAALRRRMIELESLRSRLAATGDALRESEGRYRMLVARTSDALVMVQDGVITSVNPRAIQVLRQREPELVGRRFLDLVHPEDHGLLPALDEVGRGQTSDSGPSAPLRLVDRFGTSLWVELQQVATGIDGRPATLMLFSDVSERRRAERTMMHLAYHDTLTGLPNRLLFNDRASVAIAQAHRSRSRIALALLDLDGFNRVNDSYGHTVGDELLRRIGHRIRELLRKGDTVARMGGDEFILLLPDIARDEDVQEIAAKVLEAVREPFQHGGRDLRITASLGCAVFPDDGEEVEPLLRRADQAVWAAKEAGGDTWRPVGCPAGAAALAEVQA